MKISALSGCEQTNFKGGLRLKSGSKNKSPLNLAYAAIVPLMTLLPASKAAAGDVYEKKPVNYTNVIQAGKPMSDDKKTAYVIVGLFSAIATYALTGQLKKAT